MPVFPFTKVYSILGLAILFEGTAWFFALNEFTKAKGKWGYIEAVQRGKDPTMFVVLFEDSAAMLGLLVALGGIALGEATGILYFDGIASILIGLILAGTAVWLAYETKGLLIGESANKKVIEGIRAIVLNAGPVDHVNEVLTMHMGPDFILVNISVDFAGHTVADDIEKAIDKLDLEIKQQFPNVKRVFIEAEKRNKTTD